MEHAAFLSYARDDDEYSGQAVTKFKALLQMKVREITGNKDFNIFHDKEIEIGSQWRERISNALQNEAIVLIAAITPSYFKSKACAEELEMFLENEEKGGRNDLILPIYFVEANEIENKDSADRSAKVLLQRQIVDFRQYYEERFKSDTALQQIRELAKIIKRVSEVRTQEFVDAQPPQHPRPAALSSDKDILIGEPTIYKDRINHFKEEKVFLAEKFGGYLLARLKKLCNDSQPVVLLIDAGTTLFHFFKVLSEHAIEARQSIAGKSSWIDNLTVVTNNLTGVHWLMKNGRLSHDDRWSEIALQCLLLSGIPLAAYSAVTGAKEISHSQKFISPLMPDNLLAHLKEAKEKLKNEQSEDLPRIIALVTGNWVRIRQTTPRYPILLARGRGHLSIKQSMVDLADEVYVIASLGKIFAQANRREVEEFLNDLVEEQSPHQPQYREVKVSSPKYQILGEEETATQKIKLVTTYRPPGFLLSELSALLEDQAYLGASIIRDENYATIKKPFISEAGSNLMFVFDKLPQELPAQMETEFPHSMMRDREFLRKFHVPEEYFNALFPEDSPGARR
ncbi:MAG TPA: toll/interleukin-1 receptor domain-containing protein [Pyrinomonadaceae bacterium]|nr:toll/interleukin-1 receptor domain-containing protein [Pyrinomonadaceae bacterium]